MNLPNHMLERLQALGIDPARIIASIEQDLMLADAASRLGREHVCFWRKRKRMAACGMKNATRTIDPRLVSCRACMRKGAWSTAIRLAACAQQIIDETIATPTHPVQRSARTHLAGITDRSPARDPSAGT